MLTGSFLSDNVPRLLRVLAGLFISNWPSVKPSLLDCKARRPVTGPPNAPGERVTGRVSCSSSTSTSKTRERLFRKQFGHRCSLPISFKPSDQSIQSLGNLLPAPLCYLLPLSLRAEKLRLCFRRRVRPFWYIHIAGLKRSPLMAPRQCEVCSRAPSKYKCPSCYIPYCSLACFKTHKEIPCMKPVAPIEKPMVDQEKTMRRPLSVDDASEVVLQEQLKSVAACSEIHNALANEELQGLIRKIDSSEDAENELDIAMEGDVFWIFADKILSAINH